MTTDQPRTTTDRPAAKQPSRRRAKAGEASVMVATGAAIGGGLALVGVMAAAGRSAESSSTSIESTEVGTTDPAQGEQPTVVRRVVIPVDDTPSDPTAPGARSNVAPVTRSNGS
jgi:hypothetical protein